MTHAKRPSKRALLILGMHRSGTSAAARVINLLGAELGGDLVPPSPDNPVGFWEHAEAVKINDELIQGLGRTWHDMRGMPSGWVDSPHARSAVRRIGKLIEHEFAASGMCAVKDPRMCLTAPLWIDAFGKKGFEVDCVFVVRDPREVVESLHLRNDWPRAPLYLMWVQYLMESTAASGHRRRTMITYDQLLADWRGNMRRVARELHLRWPVAPGGQVSRDVDAFLDPDQRHHRRPPREEGCEDDSMPGLVTTLHRACVGIASGKGEWTAISDLHDSFEGIGRLYAAHVDHLFGERWGAERRVQAAEARLAEQASAATVVRDTMQVLEDRLGVRLGSVERGLEVTGRQLQAMEANVAAGLEGQASATAVVHGAMTQLQHEVSALSGETAARFERQRECMMAVEARIQRQHALLNTLALRLEQAANGEPSEGAAANDAQLPVDIRKLRSALASSNATVAALTASTSWKLTAPLRWLSVHVLRRPPASVGPVALAPAEPGSWDDGPSDAKTSHRDHAAAGDATEPVAAGGREGSDRRDGNPASAIGSPRWGRLALLDRYRVS